MNESPLHIFLYSEMLLNSFREIGSFERVETRIKKEVVKNIRFDY
jgi:hypothetical protein